MPSVVVIGSFNVDHAWTCAALPRPGETLGGRYTTGPGGKGFNQATAAARAGADTAFICALGDDAGGQLARSLATADGIGLHDERSASPTGTAGIYLDDEGRNSIVVAPGANADLSAEYVRGQRAVIAPAAIVLAQLESSIEATVAAFAIARSAGAITLLNPAPANAGTTGELLALAEMLTPNETEFATLVARHAGERIDPDAVAALDQARLHALCRQLLPHGTVVVTLGASGCFVSHAEEALHGDTTASYLLPAEQVRAVDTTGAGDAFNGALCAGLALGPASAFAKHVRYASRYAALSTEREGAAVAIPQHAEVASRFGIL